MSLKTPENCYRLRPFWFWNGHITRDGIVYQIDEMADKGLGGFFICPRQGLEVAYLSDSWFDLVRFACEYANGKGLQAWLYDEYPYPSGMSGGMVTWDVPSSVAKHLRYVKLTVSGGSISIPFGWAKPLCIRAVPIISSEANYDKTINLIHTLGVRQETKVYQKTGLTAYNAKRFFSYGPIWELATTLPIGEWLIDALFEESIVDFKYYGTFIDPCMSGVVESFIKTTHERTKSALGDLFGGAIQGMFTDEVGLLAKLPWSPAIGEKLLKDYGYNIAQNPQVLYDKNTKDASMWRYRYYQAIYELMNDNWHEPIAAWCTDNRLNYATEIPSVRMTTQAVSHIPGSDSCHEKVGVPLNDIIDKTYSGYRYHPKMASSLARQLDRSFSMIECFHSVGWSMTMEDAKWMVDRMVYEGVNVLVPHAAYYTTESLKKHDAPPSHFFQSPFWQHYRCFADYAARLCYLFSQGVDDIEIAVVDPVTTLFSRLGNPFHGFAYGGEDEGERRELDQFLADWRAMSKLLISNHRNFDHIDPMVLAKAEISGGAAHIGRANYKAIVLPPMASTEGALLNWIERFVQDGGIVLAAGRLPDEVIEENCDPFKLLKIFKQSDCNKFEYHTKTAIPSLDVSGTVAFLHGYGDVLINDGAKLMSDWLNLILPTPYTIDAMDDSREPLPLLTRFVHLETGFALLISNQNRQNRKVKITLHGKYSSMVLSLFYAQSGLDHLLDEMGNAVLEIVGYGSYVLLGNSENAVPFPVKAIQLPQIGWNGTVLQKNVLRLNEFKLTIDGVSAMVECGTLISQLVKHSDRLKPKLAYSGDFGTPPKAQVSYPINCAFTAYFHVAYKPLGIVLAMDNGSLSGDFEIYINDTMLPPTSFVKGGHDTLDQIEANIDNYMCIGENKIEVFLTATVGDEGILDSLYIIGSFCVEKYGNMDSVVPSIPLGDMLLPVQKGYPYYSGVIEWANQLTFYDNSEATINAPWLDGKLHDCAELIINGSSLGACAWAPYRWNCPEGVALNGINDVKLRVFGTLINLFEGSCFDYDSHKTKSVWECDN